MPQTKFNSSTAKDLKATEKAVEYYAINFNPGYAGSLGMRISPKGKKTWFIRYRLEGKPTANKFSIGQFPALMFTDAKKKATDILKNISEGGNPRQEKLQRLEDVTLSGLFDVYYKRHAIPNKAASSARNDKNNFKNHVANILGNRKARGIGRRDVIHFLDSMDHIPVMRNRVLSLLSTMFNVGIDRDLVENNPCFRIKKLEETSRDNVLKPGELQALWKQWEQVRMGKLFMVKLLTAQRDQEVRRMRWCDIRDGVWIIPARDTKNKKKPHQVPLSRQAQEIIKGIDQTGEYVFFSARAKGKHVVNTAKSFRECAASAGVKGSEGHDLRRTAATNMGDLGTSDAIIGLILNHSDKSVTTVYSRSDRTEQKRIALQKWADKLDSILGRDVSKVVEFRRQVNA